MTIDISWCIDVVVRHTFDEHKSQAHLNGKWCNVLRGSSILVVMSKWHEYLQSIFFLSKATNHKCIFEEKMQRLQPGSSIFFSCNNTTNLPSLLALKLYWAKLFVFWGMGETSLTHCVSKTSREYHLGWRLDCNALRQSWSIRQQLFIFAICQQWLWSMSWQ